MPQKTEYEASKLIFQMLLGVFYMLTLCMVVLTVFIITTTLDQDLSAKVAVYTATGIGLLVSGGISALFTYHYDVIYKRGE